MSYAFPTILQPQLFTEVIEQDHLLLNCQGQLLAGHELKG